MFGVGMSARARRATASVSLASGLIPAAAANLSNSTYWSTTAAAITGGQADPAGGTAAYLFTESASGVAPYGALMQAASYVTITAGQRVTGGIYAKKGTCLYARLIISDSGFTVGSVAWFNLNGGARETLAVFAGSPTSVSTTMTAVGSGWYWCAISAVLGSAVDAKLTLRMANADADGNDVGSKTLTYCGPRITQP